MIKLKKPFVGFYILALALALSIVAFVYYFLTYDALGYNQNLWIIALMIIAFWSMGCLLVNSLFAGNKPLWLDIFYILAAFGLTLSTILFLTPCLSPIGIYFTVGNMGDVEANAIGVPRCIVGIIFFVLAILCVLVASFINISSKKKEVKADEKV